MNHVLRSLLSCFCLVLFFSSLASAASVFFIEERMQDVEKQIEQGGSRGELSRSEYMRLRNRLIVVRHKYMSLNKSTATEKHYIDLNYQLVALEKDTERLLRSLKRR